MKTDLLAVPPNLNGSESFAERIRKDCLLHDTESWRDTMVAMNRLIAYVEQLEARVAELEAPPHRWHPT